MAATSFSISSSFLVSSYWFSITYTVVNCVVGHLWLAGIQQYTLYSEISTWSLLLIVNSNMLPELMKRYPDGSGVFPQDRVSCRSSDDDVLVSRKLSDIFALAREFT